MTDLSIRKKKKIPITASSEGVKIAENALKRLGFDSKINFAKSQLLARSTVTKFFQCQPIQPDSFKKICQELKLDWTKIAELSEEKPSQTPGITDCINPDINEGVEKMLTPTFYRQVTVIDKKTNTIKAEIKLIGDINSFGDSSRVEFILREFAGDTIKIIDIKEGSIRLTVEGSQEDIDRLVSLIKSGELKEVSGFPVEDVQILSESSEEDESNELNNKWCLVPEIVTQGIRHRDLSEVDLSDADLREVDLSGADLSGADLSGADLSDADLSDADLSDADLSGADLSGADLSNTYLSDADLSGANLSGADLSHAHLSGANLSGANLSGADLRWAYLMSTNLSGADLRIAHLRSANLSGADLRSADLSDADFRSANLRSANLRSADLRSADLRSADLRGADLRGADLSKTKVEEARFSSKLGVSESMKQDLIKKGAIFEDSPGDRSEVLTKV
ncbi:pentapeptide repeat-containing protein [Microcoleus sp. S13_B4]|uniref:pentapeptide repeat-containing protein n=1 Tax=Microcoleus sp. S13_B4 TaxID=3055408 RepID=UPI002FD0FE62